MLIKYNIFILLNIFNNKINIIAKKAAEEIFKPEIVAAFVLLKNSQTNIKEKT